MNIVIFYHPEDSYVRKIIEAAMIRSFSSAQIATTNYKMIKPFPKAAVFINPKNSDIRLIEQILKFGGKFLFLGRLSETMGKLLGLRVSPLPFEAEKWQSIDLNDKVEFNVSLAAIHYCSGHFLSQSSPYRIRHFTRYDFLDEWNNMGYGRITSLGDAWSICVSAIPDGCTPIAWIVVNGEKVSLYSSILDSSDSSIFWFNRQVGPVDSLEWHIVEKFFGDYRPNELICFPYLLEIPFGFNAAITMRLDCDQAVESAMPLFHLYRDNGIPFSLSILTCLKIGIKEIQLLNKILSYGGAIVSHSHRHYSNWGGSYDLAFEEASISKRLIESNIKKASPLRYAVSPFHQNPLYAINALADAGYLGFIGGSIHNQPEFLLGRAGRVPFANKKIITHSQQCMLHGDCFHRYHNSLEIYKQSFSNFLIANAIFGYLDHPFSDQYQYGWINEEERLAVHQELISFFKLHNHVWFCNLNDCLDFIIQKDSAFIQVQSNKVKSRYKKIKKLPNLAACWRGNKFEIMPE